MSDSIQTFRDLFRHALHFYLEAFVPDKFFPAIYDGRLYPDIDSLAEQIELHLFRFCKAKPLSAK